MLLIDVAEHTCAFIFTAAVCVCLYTVSQTGAFTDACKMCLYMYLCACLKKESLVDEGGGSCATFLFLYESFKNDTNNGVKIIINYD